MEAARVPQQELRVIVKRMMDAGESEQNIAAVIQRMSKPAPEPEPAPSSALGRFASGAGEMLNPITMAKGLYQTVRHPIDTASAIYQSQGAEFDKAVDAARSGRYSEMVGRGAASFLPVVGPLAASIGEQAGSGDIAGAAGRAVGGALAWQAPKVVAKIPTRVGGSVTPEAELAKWGLEQGIPVDVASATANPIPRAAQQLATRTSLAGGVIGTKAAKARQAGLATVGEQLAAKGYGPAATKETAGAAARSGVEASIRGFDDAANQAYGKLRQLSEGSPDVEVVAKRQAVPVDPKVIDQRFILRWLADDLKELPYQSSSRMRGQAAIDTMTDATSQEAGRRAVYQPRVAGSPIQDTLNMAGVSGTKAELATRIEKALQTGKIDPKLAKVADAYAEAWDGTQFDFDLVTPDTLTRSGVMRKVLKSPQVIPDVSEPGAARFFPDQSLPEVAKPLSTATLKAPVDLRVMRPHLKPILERLNKKKELTGQLMGDEGRAAVALDRLVNGDDFASLVDVDAALGDLKSMARGASMPELRSGGQSIAAAAVSRLSKAVDDAAAKLGPDAVEALKTGRLATRQKHAAAEVLDALKAEPVKTANAAVAPSDAAVMHLRELQRYAPESLPQVGKAVLSDLLTEATKDGGFTATQSLATKWQKLGPETKRLLFKDADYIKDLDRFWALARKMGEQSNPSGSAHVGGLMAQGYLLTDPVTLLGYQLTGAALAKALNSPKVTKLLVEGTMVPLSAKAAATARFSRLSTLIEQATKSGASQTPAPQGNK
jgi:hypothetical protein